MLNWSTRRSGQRRSWHPTRRGAALASSPGAKAGGATDAPDGVAAVDIGAVITETDGVADGAPSDPPGSLDATATTIATTKAVAAVSLKACHGNRGRDPESRGTAPLCPASGDDPPREMRAHT